MTSGAIRARVAVLTVSDGVHAGTRADESGDAVARMLESAGYELVARRVVPDEAEEISAALVELTSAVSLVLTTGGTGFGPRDVTPEATRKVLEREAPGLVFLMLAAGTASTPLAALSRATAGSVGKTLIVNLPGSRRGATESLAAVVPVLSHAIDLLSGDTEHRPAPAT